MPAQVGVRGVWSNTFSPTPAVLSRNGHSNGHHIMYPPVYNRLHIQGDNRINAAEWRFLISGMSPGQSQLDNPDPGWIEVNVWGEIRALCGLDYFKDFAANFSQRTVAWRR